MYVSIIVRGKNEVRLKVLADRLSAGNKSGPVLSREAFAEKYGADDADMASVHRFATQHGLCVDHESQAGRIVVLSGSVEQLNSAFGMPLLALGAGGIVDESARNVNVPFELTGVVTAILGFDTRKIASPRDA